jgi:heme-degrading monooxygenase HmoA
LASSAVNAFVELKGIRSKDVRATALFFVAALPFMLSVCGNRQRQPAPSVSQNNQAELAPANERDERRGMIRVFYRWKVKAAEEERFVKAWAQTTKTIRARVKGARGSLLLRNRANRSEFLALARWDSFDDWQAFQRGGSPDAESSQAMRAAGDLLSAEVFGEIHDYLDYSSWKTRMIRIYRLKIKEGEEETFIKTWQRVSQAINARNKGARGALLMRDRQQHSSFIEVVRWDSLEDWQAFTASEPADPPGFKIIFELMTLQSTEVMDEVENLLDDAT